jgi:hypothetical protein
MKSRATMLSSLFVNQKGIIMPFFGEQQPQVGVVVCVHFLESHRFHFALRNRRQMLKVKFN